MIRTESGRAHGNAAEICLKQTGRMKTQNGFHPPPLFCVTLCRFFAVKGIHKRMCRIRRSFGVCFEDLREIHRMGIAVGSLLVASVIPAFHFLLGAGQIHFSL